MSREILRQIIEDFSPEKFINFFRIKNPNFRPLEINLGIENEDFSLSKKIGEVQFEDNNIIFCTFKVLKELTERSGKKKQYELGKRILKNENADAGIFIFYDKDNKFRFSLIYTEYFGTKRKFSHFKRFTYFVSKDQTNNTFLRQVGDGDFSSLEKIKEAFSVEPITKEFYKEIQTWFFTALDKIYFPDNKEETKPLHLIRLLSRLIFIWFIKQKGLIPDKIFDQNELKEIVKDFNVSQNSCNYYNAILQNLFFATLNQPIKDRGWAFNRGFPENKNTYGIKQLYRYEDKFLISPEKVMEIFSEIPFINGGLFDCLDKEDESGKVIYVDGFSREEKRRAKIPDYLFFSEEIKTDLSKYQIKSNQKARGLIDILKSYNFTIDEATPIDQEVALDPELLGKIFENLLAVYNPETATTARKATGSYYTPREIVEYMVHQSLLEYLKTKLPEIPEEKLDLLLSYSDEEINLEEKQKEKIVEIISEIKIIDPACGSGAFPMGILNKLVYVLGKIDPKNEYWKKIQIRKLKEEIRKLSEKDEKEIEEHFKEIEETFNENLFYPDYARKLYLIENCIFGVDIQQIATQLSKLRFFISLIIDQKVDKNKENFGIIPLPNLDLKFITANSLIGLGIEKDVQLTLFKDEKIQKLFNDIKEQYHRYFRAKLRGDKKKIRDKIEQLEKNLIDSLRSTIKSEKKKELEQLISQAKKIQEDIEKIKLEPEQFQVIEQQKLFGGITQLRINLKQERIKSKLKELKQVNKKIEEIKKVVSGDILNQVAQKILAFKPFDPNYSNPWFEPEWTFGVSDGFDIVIGNPPYGNLLGKGVNKDTKSFVEKYYKYSTISDISSPFIERSVNLIRDQGNLVFIITYAITFNKDFYKNRDLLANGFEKVIIYSFDRDRCRIFQNMSQSVSILQCFNKGASIKRGIFTSRMFRGNPDIYKIEFTNCNNFLLPKGASYNQSHRLPKIGEKINKQILEKLFKFKEIIENILKTSGSKLWIRTSGNYWYNAFDKKPYDSVEISFLHVEKVFENFLILLINSSLFYFWCRVYGDGRHLNRDILGCFPLLSKEKILQYNLLLEKMKQRFMSKLFSVFDKEHKRFTSSVIKSEIDLLDLIICRYLYNLNYIELVHILNYDFEVRGGNKLEEPFKSLIDKILEIQKQDPKADITEYEKQIDQLVYKLYNLTEDEIKIIEEYGTR
jgi:adenine-specific DNA-methyltransferase